jgi:DNA polymerase-3 subunit delta
MKFQHKDLAKLSKSYPPQVLAILVYGPDAGHVAETAKLLGESVVDDIKDPFAVVNTDSDKLRRDPASLIDSAMAFSMTGGRRLVRVRNATDALTLLIDELIKLPAIEAKIILEAGHLDSRSKLKLLFERNEKLGALACYGDQGINLEYFIKNTLGDNKINATKDALDYLFAHLGNDRQHTKNELEKIILMVGGGGKLNLEDAASSVGDAGAMVLENIAFSAGSGDLKALTISLQRAGEDGQNPVAILRTTINHFQRLYNTVGLMDDGVIIAAALKTLRPPVFWNRQKEFEQQTKSWRLKKLETALRRLHQSELECKTTGMPQMAVCAQAILGICMANQRRH